jgi:hypothetical protein
VVLTRDAGRLCLVLERLPETVFEPDFVSDAPLVRFEAYADQSRIFGWVRLRADRLSDLLNAHTELELLNAELEDLADGRRSTADEIVVRRPQLIAVHASEPRGLPALRQPTTAVPLAVRSGPYLIGGRVHAVAGTEPMAGLWERPPMIPLTDAWIEFRSGHVRERQAVGTLVVNRDLAERIELVAGDDAAVR